MKKLCLEIFLLFFLIILIYGVEQCSNKDVIIDSAEIVSVYPRSEKSIMLYSENILLVDLEKEKILIEDQADVPIYPASLTKIMTAIVALESVGNWDETFIVPMEILQPLKEAQASMSGFMAGERVSVKDLLYATLLSSGADAALTLAYGIAGDEAAFVELMNTKAKALEMDHSHFTNVTGLHDDKHVTTLKDLSILLKYAMTNPVFYKIFTTKVYTCTSNAAHPEGLKLESTLFSKIAGTSEILGGKTGYTPQAGLCLASIAKINEKKYILLTANAPGNSSAAPYHIADAFKIYQALKDWSGIE